jgi:hypothetical protein
MYYERYGPPVIKTGLGRVEIPVKPVISVPIPKYPNTKITTNFIPNALRWQESLRRRKQLDMSKNSGRSPLEN